MQVIHLAYVIGFVVTIMLTYPLSIFAEYQGQMMAETRSTWEQNQPVILIQR